MSLIRILTHNSRLGSLVMKHLLFRSSRRCNAEEEASGESPSQVDVVGGEVHEPLEASPVRVRIARLGNSLIQKKVLLYSFDIPLLASCLLSLSGNPACCAS